MNYFAIKCRFNPSKSNLVFGNVLGFEFDFHGFFKANKIHDYIEMTVNNNTVEMEIE